MNPRKRVSQLFMSIYDILGPFLGTRGAALGIAMCLPSWSPNIPGQGIVIVRSSGPLVLLFSLQRACSSVGGSRFFPGHHVLRYTPRALVHTAGLESCDFVLTLMTTSMV